MNKIIILFLCIISFSQLKAELHKSKKLNMMDKDKKSEIYIECFFVERVVKDLLQYPRTLSNRGEKIFYQYDDVIFELDDENKKDARRDLKKESIKIVKQNNSFFLEEESAIFNPKVVCLRRERSRTADNSLYFYKINHFFEEYVRDGNSLIIINPEKNKHGNYYVVKIDLFGVYEMVYYTGFCEMKESAIKEFLKICKDEKEGVWIYNK